MRAKDKVLFLNEGILRYVQQRSIGSKASELLFIQATDIDEGLVTMKFLEPGDPDDSYDVVLQAKEKTLSGCYDVIEEVCELIALRRGNQVTIANRDTRPKSTHGIAIMGGGVSLSIDQVTTLTLAAGGADIAIPFEAAKGVPNAYFYEAKIIGFDPAANDGAGAFDETKFVTKEGSIGGAWGTQANASINFDADDVLEVFAVDDVFAVRVKAYSLSNPTGITDENTGATDGAGYTFVGA